MLCWECYFFSAHLSALGFVFVACFYELWSGKLFGYWKISHVLRKCWVAFALCFVSLPICTVKLCLISFAFSGLWAESIALYSIELKIHLNTFSSNHIISEHLRPGSLNSHTCPWHIYCFPHVWQIIWYVLDDFSPSPYLSHSIILVQNKL